MAAGISLTVGSATGSTYNLTALGTQDWIVYPSTTPVRKNGGGSLITVAHVGSFSDNVAGGTTSTSTWTDGATTVSGSTTSVIFSGSGAGTGYSFTVPADTLQRSLVILTGVYNSGLQITASLADGSAASQTDSSFVVPAGQSAQGIATIVYSASTTTTLTVTVVLTTSASGANANTQAAALTTGVPFSIGGSAKRGRRPRTHH